MKKILMLLMMAGFLAAWPIHTVLAQETGQKGASATDEYSDEFLDDDMDFLEEEEEGNIQVVQIADPIEPFNRAMFVVNDKLYFYCLKPLGQGYKAITPSFFRTGVKNFFQNVETPIRLVNCLLQGKPKKAGTEILRFMVNTTVGIGGLGDPARKYHDLEVADEDFGQTLAVWGVGQGAYVVLPFLGPMSVRHGAGKVPDYFLKPQTYVFDQWETSAMVWGGEQLNAVAMRIGDYEAMKAAAIDPYDAMKNGYAQLRDKKIAE
ncbi:MAG: VacJ family lipoprotein [Desulfatibacillum sp.]|nr:VacJ family lipoprotein [Desulfatibacillum sp.]